MPSQYGELKGWKQAELAPSLEAFRRSCATMLKRPEDKPMKESDVRFGTYGAWRDACLAVQDVPDTADTSAVRRFFEQYFMPWQATNGSKQEGLLTGYYEIALQGSRTRSERYSVPLLGLPDDIISADLGAFREEWKGKTVLGRVEGKTFIPYHDRTAIEEGALDNQDLELVWVDSAAEAFFLHIQGSGRVMMDDGTEVRVGYAGKNGHPYRSLGRILVDEGQMKLEDVTAPAIFEWLATHPQEGAELMRRNPSYVFFRELEGEGPIGAQGVALVPEHALAVDRKFWPLGVPVWVETTLPPMVSTMPEGGVVAKPYQQLMVMQDTGGAIRGPLRGDVFFGHGERAAYLAGHMKQRGRWTVLLPRESRDGRLSVSEPEL